MTKQYRQGDLLFVEVPEAEGRGGQARPDGIIMRGEATGHAHRLEDLMAGALVEREGTLYLRVAAPEARVVHEEHEPVTLPQGTYRVVRQREYRDGSFDPVAD